MKLSSTAKLAKGLPAVVAAIAFLHSPSASALPAIGVNPFGTGTTAGYAYTDVWDMDVDSALAVGFNPATLIPPSAPYDFTLLAQSNVVGFSLGGAAVFPGQFGAAPAPGNAALNLNNSVNPYGYEITKVINIQERVLSNDGLNANFGNAVQTADVDANTAGLQQLAIYLDPLGDGSASVPGNGAGTVSGYTDGTLIMSARLVDNVSSFAASGAVGTGSFRLTWVIDYANADYLDITTGSIFGEELTGSTGVPSLYTPANMWNGVATNTGLLLRVESSENFFAVPEPSSLALAGLALVGLGASFGRRRTK